MIYRQLYSSWAINNMAFTLQHPYLRLPAFIYPPKCLWRPRKFSHTPVCQAAGAKKAIAQMRQPPQKSLKVANKEALKADTLPNDIGLLPGASAYGIFLRLPTWLSES